MQAEVAKAFSVPELKATWASQGAGVGDEPGEQFRAFFPTETGKWGKLAREAKVRID